MMKKQKSALVVIDLQNDFTLETGKAHACVSQVNKLFYVVNQLSKSLLKQSKLFILKQNGRIHW